MSSFSFGFWNLQNLFDAIPNEIATDLEFTPDAGWTAERVEQKITNLAEIINLMDDGGPDLLGICEIESKSLLERLVAKLDRDDYLIAHDESPDLRGIDCSLIYSGDVFEMSTPIGHQVHFRFKTRDIFEIPLTVKGNGAELIVFVNHWPSRWRGTPETEPFRIALAAHLGKLADKYLKMEFEELKNLPDDPISRAALEQRWNRNILILGDLNDEPFDHSVRITLQAAHTQDRIEEPLLPKEKNLPTEISDYLRRQEYFFNYSWKWLGPEAKGTIYFSKKGNTRTKQVFDQIIASRGLFFGTQGLHVDPQSVTIFDPKIMWTNPNLTDEKAQEKPHLVRPKAFEKSTGKGYSDHFPVMGKIDLL